MMFFFFKKNFLGRVGFNVCSDCINRGIRHDFMQVMRTEGQTEKAHLHLQIALSIYEDQRELDADFIKSTICTTRFRKRSRSHVDVFHLTL